VIAIYNVSIGTPENTSNSQLTVARYDAVSLIKPRGSETCAIGCRSSFEVAEWLDS